MMEKRLQNLFDYQRFENNDRLSAMLSDAFGFTDGRVFANLINGILVEGFQLLALSFFRYLAAGGRKRGLVIPSFLQKYHHRYSIHRSR